MAKRSSHEGGKGASVQTLLAPKPARQGKTSGGASHSASRSSIALALGAPRQTRLDSFVMPAVQEEGEPIVTEDILAYGNISMEGLGAVVAQCIQSDKVSGK